METFIDSLKFELIHKISLGIVSKSHLRACSQKYYANFPERSTPLFFIVMELIKLQCVILFSHAESLLKVIFLGTYKEYKPINIESNSKLN